MGGEWSAARPGRTLPPGKTRYPFYRRLGGPQSGLDGRKSRPYRHCDLLLHVSIFTYDYHQGAFIKAWPNYIIIIIIIFINCNCVITRWQWLFYMYTKKMNLVTTEFKSGGLHQKHVVATWNFGNRLSVCL